MASARGLMHTSPHKSDANTMPLLAPHPKLCPCRAHSSRLQARSPHPKSWVARLRSAEQNWRSVCEACAGVCTYDMRERGHAFDHQVCALCESDNTGQKQRSLGSRARAASNLQATHHLALRCMRNASTGPHVARPGVIHVPKHLF